MASDHEIPLEFNVAGGRVSGCVLDLAPGGQFVVDYLGWHSAQAQAVGEELGARKAPVALLYTVEVEEEMRGCGLGNALLQQFLERARAHGAEECLLLCDEEEEQSEGFDLSSWYERHGFEQVYQSPASGCLLMVSSGDLAARLRELHCDQFMDATHGPSI